MKYAHKRRLLHKCIVAVEGQTEVWLRSALSCCVSVGLMDIILTLKINDIKTHSIMKQVNNLILRLVISLLIPLVSSCSNDDESSSDTDLITNAIGTWMCTQSVDTQNGESFQGLMVGKEVTINSDGTYSSTAQTFGFTGTYSVSGNKITARSSNGGTFVITVTINGDRMVWEGTASYGVSFRYTFERETHGRSYDTFSKELIAGDDIVWTVESITIERGSSDAITEGEYIHFYEDGRCEGFEYMETAWHLNNGKIETFYEETNEPIYVYTLLSQNDNVLKVRVNGTLDDDFQATLVLIKTIVVPPAEVLETGFFSSKGSIANIRDVCYARCADFIASQLALERLRTNKATVHDITPTSKEINQAWQNAYATINIANIIISGKEQMGNVLTANELSELIAEVRAIRSLVYCNLAMLWGDVPLVKILGEPGDAYPRSKQSDVYKFAYEEIITALTSLPSTDITDFKLHFNKDAGYMLKAELELNMSQPDVAQNTLKQINRNFYEGLLTHVDVAPEKPVILAFSKLVDEGRIYPVYTYSHILLFESEIANSLNVSSDWSLPFIEYGYWAALKRTGMAEEITGCLDYELLMPIPNAEIYSNPSLTQNVGY